MDITSAVGFETKQFRFCYTTRDLIIYALGIGCSSEILDEKRYIFELHRDFCEFPTFFSTLPFKGDSHDIVPFPGPTLLLVPPDFVQVSFLFLALTRFQCYIKLHTYRYCCLVVSSIIHRNLCLLDRWILVAMNYLHRVKLSGSSRGNTFH